MIFPCSRSDHHGSCHQFTHSKRKPRPTLIRAALGRPLPIALIPGLTPLFTAGETPLVGPTLLPNVFADLVPAATDATGGLALDPIALVLLATAAFPAIGRAGGTLVRAVDVELELAVLAILVVRVLCLNAPGAAVLASVPDGFRVVVGMKPDEGFRAMLSARDDPDA